MRGEKNEWRSKARLSESSLARSRAVGLWWPFCCWDLGPPACFCFCFSFSGYSRSLGGKLGPWGQGRERVIACSQVIGSGFSCVDVDPQTLDQSINMGSADKWAAAPMSRPTRDLYQYGLKCRRSNEASGCGSCGGVASRLKYKVMRGDAVC